jgi:hypothetical protein
MRFGGWLAIALAVCVLGAAGAWAFVSNKVNVSRENGYAVLAPPPADALVSKENGYAVLKLPAADALVSKENGYAVLRPPCWQALVSKVNTYAVITKSIPRVQILQ